MCQILHAVPALFENRIAFIIILFCFVSVGLYMSPVETWCRNLDYYIPVENDEISSFSPERMTKIREYQAKVLVFVRPEK